MTRLQELKTVMSAAVLLLEQARLAAQRARVPDSDIATSDIPTTVCGWYPQPTKGGREAWQYRYWKSGREMRNHPVYDREALDQLEMAAWAWREARREYKEELRLAQIKSALLGPRVPCDRGNTPMAGQSSTVQTRAICEDPCADDVIALIDGELGPEQADRVRDHLATCEICAAELREVSVLTAQISALTRKGA